MHEMSKRSNTVFWENKKNLSICRLLKIVPRVLSVRDAPKYQPLGLDHCMRVCVRVCMSLCVY